MYVCAYFFADDDKVRDVFFAEIQKIIDREVETRLDNLIIFGDDDISKPKVVPRTVSKRPILVSRSWLQ